MGPPTRASTRSQRSPSIKCDARTDGRSQTPQASAMSVTTATSATSAMSAKGSPPVKDAKRSSVSENIPVIFLVGPNRTIYHLDKLSDAAKVQLAPYVRDLQAEIRAVRRIRKHLQNAVFIGNELREDMDVETVKAAIQHLEARGRLQYATLKVTNIVKVLRRVMTANIPLSEDFHALPRVHGLIVTHKDAEKDAENNAFLTTPADPVPDLSSATPSKTSQDSTSITIPLPETLPATFNHLVKWLDTPDSLSTRTNADSHGEMADLTIAELAQLYLLAVKLRLTALANHVGACLVDLEIDAPTMQDLVNFINHETAPNSDLRQFLVTAVVRYGTTDAFKEAVKEDWMAKQVASDVTLALVRERDGMLRQLREEPSAVAEAVTEEKGAGAVEKGGRAAGSKKRGAAEVAATAPKGKKRKT